MEILSVYSVLIKLAAKKATVMEKVTYLHLFDCCYTAKNSTANLKKLSRIGYCKFQKYRLELITIIRSNFFTVYCIVALIFDQNLLLIIFILFCMLQIESFRLQLYSCL